MTHCNKLWYRLYC